MKKILSGMLFRLVRGYEIWALLALFFLISGYFTFVEIATLDYVAVKTGYTNTFYIDMENSVITKENAEQYCYKNSGISAYDLYRYRIEKLPQETFDKIHKDMNSEPVYEVRTIFRLVFRSYLVASVLMVIFIPIFFGRLFSDGTIKNLVSGGYSKRLIYLSSLLLTFAIDLVLNVASLVIIAVLCLILQWLPPIYLPVLLPAFLLSVLLSFTITSVSIGSLFAGGKKTVAFILGFVMVAARFFSSSFFASGLLLSGQLMSYHDLSEETKELIKESGPNNLEVKLDLSQFIEKFYINGERVIYVFADESTYPKAVVNTLLVLVYGDPYLIDTTFVYVGYDAYSMARDGLMAINFAANAFWILFFNGVALFIFNKRELHC